MIKITDEILNKYIDGELSFEEMSEVKKQIENSNIVQLKLKALSAIHNELSKIKMPEVSSEFTHNVMSRLGSRVQAKKEQKYFIFSMSTIFIVASLIIIGFALSSLFNAPAASSVTAESMSDTMLDFSLFITNFFTSKNITIYGSIISGGIIISAYFFFDGQKRKNFSK